MTKKKQPTNSPRVNFDFILSLCTPFVLPLRLLPSTNLCPLLPSIFILYLSIYLSTYLFSSYLLTHLSIHLFLPIDPPSFQSIFAYLLTWPSISMFLYLCTCTLTFLLLHSSICLSIYLSAFPITYASKFRHQRPETTTGCEEKFLRSKYIDLFLFVFFFFCNSFVSVTARCVVY